MNREHSRASQSDIYYLNEVDFDRHSSKAKKMEEGSLKTYNLDVTDVTPTVRNNTEPPTLWSRDYFGLAASYFITGIFFGFLNFIYPLVVLVNHKSPAFTASADALITLFWSYKVFFGMISDNIPLFGYRRKAYILIGHGVAITITFLLAFVSENMSIEVVILLMTIQNFFYVFADTASDGFTVQLAHMEPDYCRGKTQSNIYLAKDTATALSSLICALGMSGPYYSSDSMFAFELMPNDIFLVFACITASAYPFLIFCLKEANSFEKKTGFKQSFVELKNVIAQRPIYQLISFTLVNSFLMSLSNPTLPIYNSEVLGVSNFQNQLNSIFEMMMILTGTFIIKRWCLQMDWRIMLSVTTILTVLLGQVYFLFIYNVTHNSWLWVFLTASKSLPASMLFIISSFYMVEVSKNGQEAMTYCLLATAHCLSLTVTTPISNMLMSTIDSRLNDDEFIAGDSDEFRHSWSKLQVLISCLQVSSLMVIQLFPSQKEAARALFDKRSIKWLGYIIAMITLLLLFYLTATDILGIVPSTQCLVIVGGSGC